jgi:type IV secretory pathway VirB10-like protein
MRDEYEDDDATVPAATPVGKAVSGDGQARTFDRRIPALIGAALLVGAGCYGYVVQTTRASMTQPASAATVPPLTLDSTNLKLPSAASPTPVAIASALRTLRPETPAPIAYAPPPEVHADTAPAAQPRTPSPEEEFAEQERRRILEARRASSRVTFDQDSQLAQQNAHDTADLAHGSAMISQASTGYLPTNTRYGVNRGTIINATWEVNYDSTLPGGVLKAKVSKNVLDSLTHSVVVIPAGAFINGSSAPQDQPGRARGLTFWDEVEMPPPDSRKFDMGGNVGSGRAGENGVDVTVNTHAGQDFGRAAFYSVLQAGVNLASRASTVVDFGAGTSQVLQPPPRSVPTFYAKIGDPLTIIVAHDLPLDRFQETKQ